MTAARRTLFSGIQPTGGFHLGNFEGAVRNWVRLQDTFDCLFCVVDWHAITQRYEPERLGERIVDLSSWILASGVDPARAILFVQSDVPFHLELSWYFASVTAMGDLSRQTQFKDKSLHDPDNVNVGLFTYPVLQAADILLYRAEAVPVGEDQVQHLELARDVARRWNHRYGAYFPEPQPVLAPGKRLLGLDGEFKMSKSRGNGIFLADEAAATWERLKGAKTDVRRKRRSDPGEPEDCNIFSLHRLYTDAPRCQEIAGLCRSAGIGCFDCKRELANNVEAVIGPVRERHRAWSSRPDTVRDVLQDGAARARALAGPTMELVRQRMGLAPARGGTP